MLIAYFCYYLIITILKGYYNMNDTIKIVYKNYRDEQDTINVPLIKEEDTVVIMLMNNTKYS